MKKSPLKTTKFNGSENSWKWEHHKKSDTNAKAAIHHTKKEAEHLNHADTHFRMAEQNKYPSIKKAHENRAERHMKRARRHGFASRFHGVGGGRNHETADYITGKAPL